MAIYKPTNCFPFAGAIDITQAFITIERQEDYTWVWKKPDPIYFTCQVETDNLPVIGYKLRMYIDGKLAFEGAEISPINELGPVAGDATANSGVNGTFLAIPAIQCGAGPEYVFSRSYNSLYLTGEKQNITDTNTTSFAIKADYIVYAFPDASGADNFSNWTHTGTGIFVYNGTNLDYASPRRGWDGTLNGGHMVTKDDVVAFVGQVGSVLYISLCTLTENGEGFESWGLQEVNAGYSSALFIAKGERCGFYGYSLSSGAILLRDSVDWAKMFSQCSGELSDPSAMAGFGSSQLSWEIELYQGPADYSSLLEGGDPDYFSNGTEDIPVQYYNMRIASGTILGSCAKRLHLRSSLRKDPSDPTSFMLPGEDLSSPLILQDTYCELYYAVDSDTSSYSAMYNPANKMVPSFPISSFDATLGLVYPKQYSASDGGLTQASLEAFLKKVPTHQALPYGVFARFFKYSSNASDTLSNEKVQAAFWNLLDQTTDPEVYLVPGAVVDGIQVQPGDRILWNTKYDSGFKNGIWVVSKEGVAPTRPADGNDYSDYIGKVVLIVDGNTYAATVAESTAEAGGSYDLGAIPLFFREQTPILINRYEPTGVLSGSELPNGYAEEIISDGILEDYFISNKDGASVSALPIPVVHVNGHVLIRSRREYAEGVVGNNVYYLELSNGCVQYSNTYISGYVPYTWFEETYVEDSTIVNSTTFNTAKNTYGHIYIKPDPDSKPWLYEEVLSFVGSRSYYHKNCDPNYPLVPIKTERNLYIKGISVNSEAGKTFYSMYGLGANRMFVIDIYYMIRIYEPSCCAKVLFNSVDATYISPSSQDLGGMRISLKGGAQATIGGEAVSEFRINTFNSKFNYITHSTLAAPLESAEDEGATPPTPYRYDIMSCFRASDLNSFEEAAPLIPHIEPSGPAGFIKGGYSALADASCFQGDGFAWNSARLLIPEGDSPSLYQDTGWFSSLGLKTEYMGLEPSDLHDSSIYAKDAQGRVRISGREIKIMPDTPQALSRLGFTLMPAAAPTGGSSSFAMGFKIGAEENGFDASNLSDYETTVDGRSFGPHSGYGGLEHVYLTLDGDDVLVDMKFGTTSSVDSEVLTVAVSLGSPNGPIFVRAAFGVGAGGQFVEYLYSEIHTPTEPAFTGTFPGTLTAESDCSTQSVMLTYDPGDDSGSLPADQLGSYDIFRREYADFSKSIICPPGQQPQDGLWFGEWEPAAIGCKTLSVRDFNVKQGHSYQYAIFPKASSTLKVEAQATGVDSDYSDTGSANTGIWYDDEDGAWRVFVAFDNSFMGMPYGFTIKQPDDLTVPSDILIAASDADGAWTLTNPAVLRNGASGSDEPHAYITAGFSVPSQLQQPEFPVTADVTVRYYGLTYTARVVFSSYDEYTVLPLGGDLGWRKRLFANSGSPVYVQWDAWSLVELEELDAAASFDAPLTRHPILKKAYKANLESIWLFRYDAEPGSQSINLTKGEIPTLGRYKRFSSGSLNAEGGEISAWLGSEVVPGTRLGYIERRRQTIWSPAATNEAAAMLAAFREMVASDTPKLLRDRKGRSWIVQVSGGSSSTSDNIIGTPTKVTVSWQEIAATGPYVSIVGDGDALPPLDTDGEWRPNIITTAP